MENTLFGNRMPIGDKLEETIKACFEVVNDKGQPLPVMLLGAVGCGKTTTAIKVAKDVGCDHIHVFNGQVRQPYDIQGTPAHTTDDKLKRTITTWATPEEWLKVANAKNPCVIFDECTNYAEEMIDACDRIVNEGVAGDLKLPANLKVILCGNREQDSNLYREPSAKTMDRVVAIEVIADAESVRHYFARSGKNPLTTAYIKTFPKSINEGVNPDKMKIATPRGFEDISNMEDKVAEGLISTSILEIMVKGRVGEEIGNEYITYRRIASKLPKRSDIYSDPMNAPLPQELDVQYAMSSMLVYYADMTNIESTVRYANRIGENGNPEIPTMMILDLHRKNPDFMGNKYFAEQLLTGDHANLAQELI